jgi:hypothetical protein
MTLLRIILFISVLAAATACVAADFLYYPEYADVFSKYDVVTVPVAKKFATERGYVDTKPGAIICEPLLRRDVAGMPTSYELSFYNGNDLDAARRWNDIIKTVNSGCKTTASELGEKFKFFDDDEVYFRFKSCVISAYTFGSGILRAGGQPYGLAGYNAAYEKAAEVLGTRDLFFVRVIGGGALAARVFEFENRSGKSVAVGVPYYASDDCETEVIDLGLLASLAEISARSLHRSIGADPARFAEYDEYWKNLDERIPDELVEIEFPRTNDDNVFRLAPAGR